jgi:hypothetical protein
MKRAPRVILSAAKDLYVTVTQADFAIDASLRTA